ncbi:MAG: hypothetical protein OEM24_05900 [Paracoccaceae bacterium]|nr:hypothetical protein [Paracoccaceae bacterium]
MLHLVIGVIAGAVTGNIPGRVAANLDIGIFGNSITGALGGLIGQRMIGALALGGGGADLYSLAASVIAGAFGGGVMMGLAAVVRNRISK